MAQKVEVTVTDDLDGTPGAKSVQFAVGKSMFEVDLSPANEQRLHAALAPFVKAAHSPSRDYQRAMNHATTSNGGDPRGGVTHLHPPRDRASRARAGNIRAWAKEQGIPIGEKGRIPAGIEREYDAAHRGTL